jgi:glucose/arabinose dehydrogenase
MNSRTMKSRILIVIALSFLLTPSLKKVSARVGSPVCVTNPVVANNSDSGAGSLRQAIADACDGSTITFSGVVSPITLTTEVAIDKNVTIQGPGSAALTISGNNAVRVLNIGSVTPGINVTLSGLTIANGQVTAGNNAGGILNNSTGTLSITTSVLSGNAAGGGPSRSDGKGGGIYNGSTGTVTMTNSTLSGNTVGGGPSTGANSGLGGGIFNFSTGTLNVTSSTFSNNVAQGFQHGGGGIYNNSNGAVNVTGCTLSSNSATGLVTASSGVGGGIYNNSGALNVTSSTLAGNSTQGGGQDLGGAISNESGTVTITRSTLSNNSAIGGGSPGSTGRAGGIYNGSGTVNVINSTLYANLGKGRAGVGGAICNAGGTVTLVCSTLSGNSANGVGSGPVGSGGGINNTSGGGAVNLTDTIVALNTADSSGPDVIGSFTSQGYNLIGRSDGGSGFSDGVNNDEVGSSVSPLDPNLGPLQDNGGPTQTMALLTGSKAIDTGNDAVLGPPYSLATDQRGPGFPRGLGAHVDIGAFEFPTAIQLENVLTTLSSPVFVTNAHDQSNRLFIVEQGGRIKVLQPGATAATVFLDIASRVLSGGERGLLGLAFHPYYKTTGRFFVYYTRQTDGAIQIAEYHVSAADPNVADTTERIIITIPHPTNSNHNGGTVVFGPDGYLYAGTGDGGAGNDPPNNAQNINVLLGKIIRLDIDHTNGAIPYAVPSDNPFVGVTGADEIYMVGMRNPYRFSFDRDGSHQMYVADVGQGQWEEIDIGQLGGNFGWRIYEGNHCTGNDPGLCNPGGFVFPIAEYQHLSGRCSITGGYVYRGTRGIVTQGDYVYGDYCTGEIFKLHGGVQSVLLDLPTNNTLSGFGEDEEGELYIVRLNGSLDRLAQTTQPCFVTVNPASQSFPASGGAGTVVVDAAPGCAWTVTNSDPSVLTVTSATSGSGYGFVTYTVSANPNTTPRNGTLIISGLNFTVAQGAAFLDVPTNHLFYKEIGKLSARGVTVGDGNGNFLPELAVTREQMAAFIIRALGDFNPPTPATQRFADVPPSNIFYAFIEEMAVRQITVGCDQQGTIYCPGDAVTREQMAAFIMRALGEYLPPTPPSQRFTDVPPSNQFYPFIDRLWIRGVTVGCGGTNFCPADPVTRGQMAAFLVRAFNL